MSDTVDVRKTIEKNASKTNKVGTDKDFLACIKNMSEEWRRTITPLGGSITRNRMMVTEQRFQILFLTTDIGGSVSIANTLRTDTVNWKDPNIQPTIVHLKQATGLGHSDRNHFLNRLVNSDIYIPRYVGNIDNRTGMDPQGPIMNTVPKSNRSSIYNIFKSVNRTFDIVYRGSLWHVTIKSESENLVENIRGNNIFKNA